MPTLGQSSDRRAIAGQPGACRLFIRRSSRHPAGFRAAHERSTDRSAAGNPHNGRRRRHLDPDLEHDQRDRLRGIGRLERGPSDQRQHVDGRTEGEHELYLDLRRGHRHHSGIGHGPRHRVAGAHGDADGKPQQRGRRQRLNADLDHHERDLVHGIGRLERDSRNQRQSPDGRPQRNHDLHADVRRRSRHHAGFGHRHRHCDITRAAAETDCHAGREPYERGARGRLDTHVEHRERIYVHGIGRLERNEGGRRQRIDRGDQCDDDLHAHLLGRGRHHSRRGQRHCDRDRGSVLADGDSGREPYEPRGGS
jgi:hypothetical protein